jgi:UDP:flavonoid glycosyltransferase YjiC (YdhE family)
MRLLISVFSTGGTWGGITRVVAISEAAKLAGHEVAFCASGKAAQALRAHEYAVYDMPPSTMFGLPRPISRILERRSQNVSLPAKPGKSVGNLWFVYFVAGMARADYLRRLVEAEIAAAQSFGADMIFTDLDPGAFLMSVAAGLPIAMAYQNVMASTGIGSRSWKRMRAAILPVLKHYGCAELNPEDLWFAPSVLKIVPSIPELDGADANRPDVCYVGSLLGDIQPKPDAELQLEARRCVFVYVGTGSVPLTKLREVLPQVFPADGERTCIVGAQGLQHPEGIGAVTFRPYVPAALLLPRCDWTICHGGQNTISQSLLHGVPLIIFPGAIFERRFNAEKVQEAGAGVMGELPDFTAAWLSAALRRQAECASKAAHLSSRIRSYGGASAAVEAMERHRAKFGTTHLPTTAI